MIDGIAAGVPYVARPPVSGSAGRPVVLSWHLLDPPRSERAFAAALPLDGLDAWRIHLGLPLSGSRLPDGGVDELFRLVMADPVLNLHRPVVGGAVEEAVPAFGVLQAQLGFGDVPVGVLGGSAGAAVAGLVAIESGLDVRAVALVNPMTDLRTMIDAVSVVHGMSYDWPAEAAAFAGRVDLPRRAAGFAGKAVLVVTSEDDEQAAVNEPARRLIHALEPVARELRVTEIPGGHALVDEPGLDPAPPTDRLRALDEVVTHFFAECL